MVLHTFVVEPTLLLRAVVYTNQVKGLRASGFPASGLWGLGAYRLRIPDVVFISLSFQPTYGSMLKCGSFGYLCTPIA